MTSEREEPDKPEETVLSARQLIDEYAEEESTYDIPLKNGTRIIVRNIVHFRTLTTLRKKAQEIQSVARKGVTPPDWKPYLAQGPEPISEHLATMMADLTGLIVAPKFTLFEVLELAHKNGVFAAYLHGKIRARMEASVPAAAVEEIETEKEGSGPIDFTEPI